jgi:hypothetical protein
VTKEEEKITVICLRWSSPLAMPDNRIAVCCRCGWKVQFRPRAPRGLRMCMQCATDILSPGEALAVTERTLDELNEYFRKRQQ